MLNEKEQPLSSDPTNTTGSQDPLLPSNDKQSIKSSTKLNEIDFDKMFMKISFTMLILEVSSSIFNLVSTYVTISDHTKYLFTVIFYATHTILTLCMIVSSILALKKAAQAKKAIKEEGETKLSKENKLAIRQHNIQISENSLTIISYMLWITVCLSSLIMLFKNINNPVLEQACLLFSIISPILCTVSCILRTLDAKMENKKTTSPIKKTQTKRLMFLYSFLVFFEAIHCICHITEAVNLNGKMQNIYNFQNQFILVLEIIAICIFIVGFILEAHFNKKAQQEEQKQAANPDSTLNNMSSKSSSTYVPSL